MVEIFIYTVCLMYILSITYAVVVIYKNFKRCKSLNSYYPVKLRTTDDKILQYSIDGKEWNDIMGFYDKMKYLDKNGNIYEAPGFVRMRIGDDQTADDWQGCLGSIQKVHEWNKKAFEHYKEAIYKYLNMNEKEIMA